MMKTRLVAGGAAIALTAALVAAPSSHAATSTSGTSQTTTQLLSVDLGGGSLLSLKLAGEEGAATTSGPASALARLRSFDIASGTISALNISGPVVEATSAGTRSVTAPPLDLAAPAGFALPAGLLGGRIVPGTLTAAADADGARSTVSVTVDQLSLVGGLVSAGTLASNLGASAAATDATGTRGIEASGIRVVDLGALLQGLGIPLGNLPVGVVSDLLGQLGLAAPGLGTESLESAVTDLTTTITGLTALLEPGTLSAAGIGDLLDPGAIDQVTDALDPIEVPAETATSTIDSAAGTLTQAATDLLASVGLSPTATVQDLVNKVNELTGQLAGALTGALQVLDGAPLLSIDGIKVGVQAKAARTVESSLSEVTATIGAVNVGGLVALPGLDALAVTDQLAAALGTLQAKLDSVLGTIDAGLAGVVKVAAFEKSGSVTPLADGTKAVAGLTALTATITPPGNLAAIVQSLTDAAGIGDLLGGAGVALPSLDGAMSQLTSTLGGVRSAGYQAQAVDLGALTQGAAIRVGSISSTSTYGSAAETIAPAPEGGLPRTGGTNGFVGLTAVAALLLAVAIKRRHALLGR